MSRNWITYAKATFAVLVWGASFIATKVALQNGPAALSANAGNSGALTAVKLNEITPVTVVWLRFAMGVAILGIAVFARKQFALPQRGKEWGYFALLGFLGITFHQWLQSTGLVTAQATTTAWIVATTPIFMALLGWLVLKEKLGWLKWAGIALAALGVLLVVSKGDFKALSSGRFGAPGDFLILISAPNWAIFSVLSRRGLQSHPAARMMLYVMTFGWLFTSILFFTGPGLSEIARLSTAGWIGVGFLGVACSGLAYIFWYDALQAIPASQLGVFLYLEPLVALVVAAIILSEPVLWASLLGGGIILLGVWMVNRPKAEARFRTMQRLDQNPKSR
jgi:drug/metabolite transporter (DMT)-like permease